MRILVVKLFVAVVYYRRFRCRNTTREIFEKCLKTPLVFDYRFNYSGVIKQRNGANKMETPKTLSEVAKATILAKWKGKACEKVFTSSIFKMIEILGEDLEIPTQKIDKLKQEMDATMAPATVNQKLVNLHTVLKFGADRGWIQKVPKFTFNKLDNQRTRVLSKEEEVKLLSWLRENGHEEIAAFIELAILTACRRSELLTAEKAQVDGRFLRLWKTKTGKARSVPLTARAQELANKYIPFQIEPHTLYRVMNKAKAACGISDDVVLHSMRHTGATRMLRKSKDIHAVQKVLGHASSSMTDRYTHLVDDDLYDSIVGE